jgi:hypothetical protein
MTTKYVLRAIWPGKVSYWNGMRWQGLAKDAVRMEWDTAIELQGRLMRTVTVARLEICEVPADL